jgi:hypothetical protein
MNSNRTGTVVIVGNIIYIYILYIYIYKYITNTYIYMHIIYYAYLSICILRTYPFRRA